MHKAFAILFGVAVLMTNVCAQVSILQYALILEHLENAFYAQGLQTFNSTDFDNAGFQGQYKEFQRIAGHEATHVSFLSGAITAAGQTPLPACNYSFPYSNVKEFVAVARVLERTGVSAYLGVLAMITTPAYTTAAGTITTIESRHASYLNYINGFSGFPEAFDTPVVQRGIVELISPLITSCPFTIPIAPFPSLSISPSSGQVGTRFYLTTTTSLRGTVKYCTFLYGSQQASSTMAISNGGAYCQVPPGVTGDAYVFVTSSYKPVISVTNTESILNGPAVFTVNDFAA